MRKLLITILITNFLLASNSFAVEQGATAFRGNVGVGTTNLTGGALTVMSGNVGIGTWKPSSALQVVGAVAASGAISGSNFSGTSSGTNTGDQTSVTGNAGTATALAANGSNCSGNNFALGVDASGAGECAQPAFSNLSGAATDAQIPDNITITETDPQVGTLTNTKWCNTDGSVINCTQDAPAGGSGAWGGITGTLSDQTDLQSALDAKQNKLASNTIGNVGIGTTTPVGGTVIMNGNLGVGTWAPTNTLQVVGGGTFSGALSASNFSGTSSGTNTGDQTSVTGNAGTATALAANGTNASSGNAILGVDASGNAEGAFDVWTEAENTAAAYAPQATTITINGTAGQITSSAGAQSLAANRTWTLSLPSNVGIGTGAPVGGLSVMSGNVGIGTWSPTSALQVVGSIASTNLSGTHSGSSSGTNTGDQTTFAAFSDTSANLDTAITDDTGSGALVFATSPSLTTPTLGVASATSINKVAITAPATSSTLTIADGKTLTVTNTANISTLTDGRYCKYTASGTLIDCNSTCADITGSASLCDGSDDGAGGSGSQWITVSGVGIGTTDPVGIGTYSATASLEIVKKGSNIPFKVSSSISGSGDFLIVSSNGNVGIGTNTPVAGLAVMNGNVGIGTWSPTASLEVKTPSAGTIAMAVGGGNVGIGTNNPPQKLYVSGNVQATSFYGANNGKIGGKVAEQVFTSGAGNYIPNANLQYAQVIVTGGGASAPTCTNTDSVSSGGGAGGTSIKIWDAVGIGTWQAYTVGAGGTTGNAGSNSTFATGGSQMIGNGGAVGIGTTWVANAYMSKGGAGGSSSGGTFNFAGGDGFGSYKSDTGGGLGGNGGASFWGSGGAGGANDQVGNAGVAPGSGGGGCTAPTATDRNAGAGKDGAIYIIEYLKD